MRHLRVDGAGFIALLTGLAATGTVTNTLYIPSMPSLVDAFATSSERVKLTLTAFLVAFAVAQLVYGPLSDRHGRRQVLLAGLAIYVAGSLACLVAPTIEVMIAARCLQAVGACAGAALARAIVRDVHGREDAARVFAWIAAALAISPALGPSIGGVLQVWFGWQAAFVVLTLLGTGLLAMAILLLPETNRLPDREATSPARLLANGAMLLRHRAFVGYLLAGGLVFAGLYAYLAAGPFIFMGVLGLRADAYGFLSVFSTSAYLAGTLLAARQSARFGIDGMLLAGCVLAIGGGLALLGWGALGLSVAGIVVPMMIFSAGMGMALPSALAGGMIPFPQIAGTASAVIGFSQQGLAAAATIAAAALPQASALAMGALVTALSACALIARICLVGRHLGRGGGTT
jgi:DHA1 family bicyclomycin/chloramphenicol resistance-like MFS transporter